MDLISPELGLIIWQLIAFAILFFILAKFAWKPILSALDERDSTIEASLNEAEKARLEMENLVADNERLLQEARVERDEILRSANEFASQNLATEASQKELVEEFVKDIKLN